MTIKVLSEFNHPLYIITKSALMERDMDILIDMAEANLVQVLISVTTLDASLSRRMEPRVIAPYRRIQAIARLSKAGIPTGVLVAVRYLYLRPRQVNKWNCFDNAVSSHLSNFKTPTKTESMGRLIYVRVGNVKFTSFDSPVIPMTYSTYAW